MTNRESIPAHTATAPQRITAARTIAQILSRLQKNRNLVAITLGGNGEQYLSTILDIDPARGALLLDELSSPTAHRRLATERRFQFHSVVDGIKIAFTGYVTDAGHDSKGGYYEIPLPKTLFYYQQRAHYRARIVIGRKVAVALSRGDDALRLRGNLRDISVGGLGAIFGEQLPSPITPGEFMPGCMVTLPSGMVIACALEVRFVKTDRDRSLRIGGQFIDLPPPQQHTVESFVAEMDREFLKRLAERR